MLLIMDGKILNPYKPYMSSPRLASCPKRYILDPEGRTPPSPYTWELTEMRWILDSTIPAIGPSKTGH